MNLNFKDWLAGTNEWKENRFEWFGEISDTVNILRRGEMIILE
jgi:hypothetical protein